jgi:type IV secretory pathway TrbD component
VSNPVYKVINKPLTIMGTDRRLFFAVITLASGIWNGFDTLLGAIICFVVLIVVAQWITKTDPNLPRIIMNNDRYRPTYDPMRYKPHTLVVKK